VNRKCGKNPDQIVLTFSWKYTVFMREKKLISLKTGAGMSQHTYVKPTTHTPWLHEQLGHRHCRNIHARKWNGAKYVKHPNAVDF